MSIFGVDFGNLYSSVSVARRRGIDVIINEVSKRETSTYVSFGSEKDGRMIGEKGSDMKIRNIKNTVTHLKRMVGVKFNSEDWEQERKHAMFTTLEGPDGYVMVEVQHCGETVQFRPEQLVAMMLGKLRSYADREAQEDAHAKTNALKVIDCVLACPPYYSAFQRKLLLQATEIASLNCLTLVTEGTAVALQYGIFKSESLPEKQEDGIIVQFCDMGHSTTYITTVKFWKGNLKVLSHTYDKHLGCRDFDLMLADHFRGEIEKKYKMDVYEQKKAKLRLIAGCEKLRYTLSANATVSLNVECIMDDVDVSFKGYTRDEFETLVAPLWEKMEKLVARAAEGVDISQVTAVELVGGGSYMPKVKEILSKAFDKHVSTTLNASEAVAKGCGIIGAILSPRFQVKDFKVMDALTHEIKIGYHSDLQEGPSPVSFISDINKETTLYAKNVGFPVVFDLSFDRNVNFDLYTYYKEPCEEVQNCNGSLLLGHWKLSNLPVAKTLSGEPEPDKTVKVAVRFKLSSSGVVSVEAASVVEAYEVEEKVEKKKEEKKDDKKDDKAEEKKDEEPQTVMKKKSRKIDVNVEQVFMIGMKSDEVEAMTKAETQMAKNDQVIIDTINAKNALESYAYDSRSKAEEGGAWFEFMPAAERDTFKAACDAAADWVYGDGEEATRDEYTAKLIELRKSGDKANARKVAREDVQFVFPDVEKQLLTTSDEATRLLGTETHIDKEKLTEVVTKAKEAIDSVKKEKQALDALAMDQDVNVTAASLNAKVSELERFAKPIFNTPKPTPPKEEKPAEEAKDKEAASPKASGDAPAPAAPEAPKPGMELD